MRYSTCWVLRHVTEFAVVDIASPEMTDEVPTVELFIVDNWTIEIVPGRHGSIVCVRARDLMPLSEVTALLSMRLSFLWQPNLRHQL